eukprot:2629823-Pyramimonas_sp.AAC.1
MATSPKNTNDWRFWADAARRKRGYILMMDQSDTMHEAQVYSHDGPIRRRKRGLDLLVCDVDT